MRGQRVIGLGPGGNNEYAMGGITYLKKDDAQIIAHAIKKAYLQPGHEKLFWDNILDQNLDKISLGLHAMSNQQVLEIDTIDELKAIDSSYANASFYV